MNMIFFKRGLLLLLILVHFVSCAQNFTKDYPFSVSIEVKNTLSVPRTDEFISVSLADIKKNQPAFNSKSFIVVDNGKEIPSQLIEHDGDPRIAFVLDNLAGDEERIVALRFSRSAMPEKNYPKRTQAEISHKVGGTWNNRVYEGGTFVNINSLLVPAEHKDHSWYLRYEGPGWESDKVAYRLYLDQRNAIDVFGKKTSTMVLQNVGLDGFGSYHEMADWGMDVMKVGESLGLGSIGAFKNKKVNRVEITDSVSFRIKENGNLYSSFDVKYSGWRLGDAKTDLRAHTSITAGSRLTHLSLESSKIIDSLCTGIVKDVKAKVFMKEGDNGSFGYVATYGKQSLNSDELGLAVFFAPGVFKSFSEDKHSNLVLFKPLKSVDYYFMATWALEQNGIADKSTFLKEVEKVAQQLSSPVKVTISKSTKRKK
jgi:hypothetical protein